MAISVLRRILKLRVLTPLFALALVASTYIFKAELGRFLSVREVQLGLSRQFNHPQFMAEKLVELQGVTEALKGKPLFEVDLVAVQNSLLAVPWVAEANLFRKWPDRLVIEIQPKTLVALIMSQSGVLRPVLNDSTLMGPIRSGAIPDVPVLVGDIFQQRSDLLVKAIVVLEQIPEQGLFSRKNLAEVRFDKKRGFVFQLIEPAVDVLLGEEQVGIKSARVNQVIDYIQNRNLQARVIDANLTKKVLVRLRKDI